MPAVCPYRACRPVIGPCPGWNAFVFTETLRPFTEIDVSSTVSGSFLSELERDDAIFPNALLPAFSTTCPLTETSLASFPSKLLPAGVLEVNELTALTVIVVPAGSVAAFKDEATMQAQSTEMTVMTFVRFIRVVN